MGRKDAERTALEGKPVPKPAGLPDRFEPEKMRQAFDTALKEAEAVLGRVEAARQRGRASPLRPLPRALLSLLERALHSLLLPALLLPALILPGGRRCLLCGG